MNDTANPVTRVRLWYALLVVLFGMFAIRLFYLQIIKYDYYVKAARSDQIREYDVPAERGVITASLNGQPVPLVLNEKMYTVFADPGVIQKEDEVAGAIAPVLGMSKSKVADLLRAKDTRYVVLKKRVSPAVNKKLLSLKYAGINSQERHYRTYPQGTMAAQLLGFVNDEGQGKYGIEQALDSNLMGKPGRLKAVTDVHGIPLAANANNMLLQPRQGKNVQLTVDIGMQRQVEQIIKRAQEKFRSKNVSAVVVETNTGAVKAMANYPTYDPAAYQQVEDDALFQNYVVSTPIEPGSITKVLSTAAGIDSGAIKANSTYNDPGVWKIDGASVVNVAEGKGSGAQTVRSLLDLSLNTGATWVLMQMGGGTLNDVGRNTLYKYYTDHFRLGKSTQIEQGYEGTGYVVGPEDKDNGINITYANMAFGQAFSASALQMAAALSAIVNGGTYYQPHLVAPGSAGGSQIGAKTLKVRDAVVSAQTSQDMRNLLEYVTVSHAKSGFRYMDFGSQYNVGGKTGTAQITDEKTRLYRDDAFNGTFMGYVGGDMPQYTIVVYNIEPKGYSGYAGAQTGQPVFADIAHMLINNYDVTPKRQ